MVVASDPLEGDPREGLRLLQVRLARGAGSSEESIHETGQTFVTLLKGLRHGGRWREAQQVVEIMEGWLHRIGPGARAAVAPAPATVRRAHCPASPARPAPQRPPPRTHIYHPPQVYAEAIAACSRAGEREAALAMVARMLTKLKALEGRQRPQLAAFDHAIAACAHGGDLAAATVLLREIGRHGAQPSEHSYNHLLAVCAARGGGAAGTDALRFLHDMQARELTPPPQSAPAARPPARVRAPAPLTHTHHAPASRREGCVRRSSHTTRCSSPAAPALPSSRRSAKLRESAAPCSIRCGLRRRRRRRRRRMRRRRMRRRPRRATRRRCTARGRLGGARSPCWGRCACEAWRLTSAPTRRRLSSARAR